MLPHVRVIAIASAFQSARPTGRKLPSKCATKAQRTIPQKHFQTLRNDYIRIPGSLLLLDFNIGMSNMSISRVIVVSASRLGHGSLAWDLMYILPTKRGKNDSHILFVGHKDLSCFLLYLVLRSPPVLLLLYTSAHLKFLVSTLESPYPPFFPLPI